MKKKKICAMFLTAAMAATLLAGCGNDAGSQGSSAGGSTGGEAAQSGGASGGAASGETQDVALKVWCPQNQIDTGTMSQMQEAFAAAHPEYNITWTTEVVGEDKCQDEVLKDVGNAADVYLFSNDQLPQLVEADAIAQLGGETEAMVKNEIEEYVAATVTQDGKVYGIPFTHNTFFMYYDKTLLDENDIKTLEGIMAKPTADNVYNFYFESAGGWKLGCYYYGAGCTIFGPEGSDLSAGCDWNNATGLAVTNYLIDLINNPKCAFDGEITVSELIEEHRLGAWFDGSWNYTLYHDILGDDLGMAVIPTFNPDGTDHQLLGFYGSKAIGVNAHSKNMAAAVQFAAFIGNEENQLLRYELSNQVPANKAAASNEKVMTDPLAAVLVNESNMASVTQPVNSVFSARYWSYAGAIPTEIRSGEITKDNAQEKLDAFVTAMTAE